MLTRTTSQLLAPTGLPPKITSIAQLNSVLAMLVSTAPPQIDLTGLNINSASLMPNALPGTTKTVLPIIAKALKASSALSVEFQKVRHGLSLVLGYITSAEYQLEVAKSLIERGLLDDLIAQKIDERMEGLDHGGARPTKQRKRRDPALEEHMHYIVNKMVHRRYNKKGRVVVSDQVEWPEPAAGGKVQVEVAPGVFESVWRPQWDNFLANSDFIDEFLAEVEEEFPDEHAEAELRSSLSVFFASINRGRVDQASGKRDDVKLQQNRHSRATSVSGGFSMSDYSLVISSSKLLTSMTSYFDSSLLNKCRERNFFRQAFKSGGIFITPLGYKDQHQLPRVASTLPDGAEAGFDGFWLFADMWNGTKTAEGSDIYVVRDVEWWSPLMALGFYVLYEQSKHTKPGQRARTPISLE